MYQGARNVYCRYPATKEVEMVYDLGARHLLFLDAGLIFPGKIIWSEPDGTPHPCMPPRTTTGPGPSESTR